MLWSSHAAQLWAPGVLHPCVADLRNPTWFATSQGQLQACFANTSSILQAEKPLQMQMQ
jgi:hypothetical protein